MKNQRPLWIVGICAIPALLLVADGGAQEKSRLLVSPISSGVSILTEVSVAYPYVGEQLSVLYSLQTSRNPVAVDVQPQDYSGFWSEIVALPEQTRMITRLVNGRPVHEYLLRQVIVYPLIDGNLNLPPLSIKVMFTGAVSPDGRNWDLKGASRAVSVRALPLPPIPQGGRSSLLVGTVDGRIGESRSGIRREHFLELQGTANLAFFKPEDWIQTGRGTLISSRLVQSENTAQTLDIGGRRRIALRQYRKWSLNALTASPEPLSIDDLSIPVFQPQGAAWKTHRVAGLKAPGSTSDTSGGEAMSSPGVMQGMDSPGRINLNLVAVGAGLAVVLLSGLAWIWLRKRRSIAAGAPASAELSRLEDQIAAAPRAFLENAHRTVDRIAESRRLWGNPGIVRPLLEECIALVDHGRFTAADPPRDVCERILEILRLLTSEKERLQDPDRAIRGSPQAGETDAA